jgi:hypothetical protein
MFQASHHAHSKPVTVIIFSPKIIHVAVLQKLKPEPPKRFGHVFNPTSHHTA